MSKLSLRALKMLLKIELITVSVLMFVSILSYVVEGGSSLYFVVTGLPVFAVAIHAYKLNIDIFTLEIMD